MSITAAATAAATVVAAVVMCRGVTVSPLRARVTETQGQSVRYVRLSLVLFSCFFARRRVCACVRMCVYMRACARAWCVCVCVARARRERESEIGDRRVRGGKGN